MRTNEWLVPSMSPLEQAEALHRDMVRRESRGFGDTRNAMRRLERVGLPYWTQWNLRAGKLRGDGRALLTRVRTAWVDLLTAQVAADLRALRRELDGEAHDGTDVADLLAEAETLLADLEARRAALGRERQAGGAAR